MYGVIGCYALNYDTCQLSSIELQITSSFRIPFNLEVNFFSTAFGATHEKEKQQYHRSFAIK